MRQPGCFFQLSTQRFGKGAFSLPKYLEREADDLRAEFQLGIGKSAANNGEEREWAKGF